ncbi:unnamed protein product [Calypogeia fissa]
MAFSFASKAACLAALVLVSACVLPAKADVRAVNQCSYGLTLFYRSQGSGTTQLSFAAGQSIQLGLPNPWTGGVMWASQHANSNNGQCTQLEFNIGQSGRDYYDISLVNAYNEAVKINPTYLYQDTQNGHECGVLQCTIADISTVCQSPNYHAGPDNACINADGPGSGPTPGTNLFENACPEAYAYSTETGVVDACNTGSNYDAIWCP